MQRPSAFSLPEHQPPPPLTPDASVRSTDSEALISRYSAITLNYLSCPFTSHFLTPSQRRSPERRPPLINIGTHARTWAVDELVRSFLSSGNGNEGDVRPRKRKQVLSIGAGTDSRYWRLRKEVGEENWNCEKWVEVDFVEATSSKARTVATKNELKSLLGGPVKIEGGGTGLSSPSYTLLPIDLRTLTPTSDTALSLLQPPSQLDPTLPTLLLAECVLVYLPPETVQDVLGWFGETFSEAAAVTYDPFGLDDSFGKVMKRNLATRNLSLPSADSTPTLASLSDRLLAAGFNTAESLTIRSIREDCLPLDEFNRVAKLEMLDEVEELNLVLEHYAITFGYKSASSLSSSSPSSSPSRLGLPRRGASQ